MLCNNNDKIKLLQALESKGVKFETNETRRATNSTEDATQ